LKRQKTNWFSAFFLGLFKILCFYFLGPAACGGRALSGLAGLLGPAPASWLGLPLRGPLSGP